MSKHEDADIRRNHIQCRGIILKENEVLVIYREKNGRKYYVFPGGHNRINERLIDTAKREVFEETSINVKNLKIAFEFKRYLKELEEEYYFVGEYESGIPKLIGEELARSDENNYYEPMWVKRKEVENLTLYPLFAKEWFLDSLDKFLT